MKKFISSAAINHAKAQCENDSHATIVLLSPADFIDLAKPMPNGPDERKLENVVQLINDGVAFDEMPFLTFINNGDGTSLVVGHEGRHRMTALQGLVDRVPVLLISMGGGAVGEIIWRDVSIENMQNLPSVIRGQGYNFKNEKMFPRSILHKNANIKSRTTREILLMKNARH